MTTKQLQAIEAYAKKAMAQSLDPQHRFNHVDRVRHHALKIVKILKLESDLDLNLLQAACLLHDILYQTPPSFKTWFRESRYLRQMLPGILKQFQLSHADQYLLEESVYHHTRMWPFKSLNQKYSLYAQILQDADFLEFVTNRQRLIEFKKNKHISRFYRITSLFSGAFMRRLNKKVDSYLNLPQIIPEIIDYLKEEDQ